MAEREAGVVREPPRRHEDTKVKRLRFLAEDVEATAFDVVDAAFKVHSALGPGLLESVYEACMEHELRKRGHPVRRQTIVPVVYEGIEFEEGFRLDLLVRDMIVVEVKAVERTLPVHAAQLLTYLRLTGVRLGFLINFNVPLIKQGIRRFAV